MRAFDDFGRLRTGAGVWVVEADVGRVIQVCHTNVPARLTTLLIVDWIDIDVFIVDAGSCAADSRDKLGESDVCIHDAVIRRTVVVLDFLQEQYIRRLEVVYDLLGNGIEGGRLRAQVLHVILGECKSTAFAIGY